MRRIKIKNFGPIKEGLVSKGSDGFIEVDKLTVFIGDQGSGKSTVAKLLSTLAWLENKFSDNTFSILSYKYEDLKKDLSLHSLDTFLSDTTDLHYEGLYIRLNIKNKKIIFGLPQKEIDVIYNEELYIPTERFLFWELNDFNQKFKTGYLNDFFQLLNNNIKTINGVVNINKDLLASIDKGELNILKNKISADFIHKNLLSTGEKNQIAIIVPLIVKLKIIYSTRKLSNKNIPIGLFYIIEEPELGLYPTHQEILLRRLIDFVNVFKENSMLLTTHSPYLVNYLSILMYANKKYRTVEEKSKKALGKVASESETLDAKTVRVYEFKTDGSIKLSPIKDDLLDDENPLNNSLGEINDIFNELLDIENDA